MKRKARRIGTAKPKCRKSAEQTGFGFDMPPHPELVEIYFDQKGHLEQAAIFFAFFTERQWRSARGKPYRNWKVLASDWVFDHEQQLKLERRQRAGKSHFLTE